MRRIAPVAGLLFALVLIISGCNKRETSLVMGGGPQGGTFQIFATGLAELINRNLAGVHVRVEPSGGSVANLRNVETGKSSMALVFAGDTYLGKEGKLETGQTATGNVRALARLYGATAHLVVRRDGSIRTPYDLSNLRVAIGSHGSGSALSAKRYFQALGMWEGIIPIHASYDIGFNDLVHGAVDAVWIQVGYPNDSISKLSREIPLRFVSLRDAAVQSGFYSSYPFYSAAVIPANTYAGQENDVPAFQDSALLVANLEVNKEIVYRILRLVFSEKGVVWMHSVSPVARDLDPVKGLAGIKISLHPGAERFWKEVTGKPREDHHR